MCLSARYDSAQPCMCNLISRSVTADRIFWKIRNACFHTLQFLKPLLFFFLHLNLIKEKCLFPFCRRAQGCFTTIRDTNTSFRCRTCRANSAVYYSYQPQGRVTSDLLWFSRRSPASADSSGPLWQSGGVAGRRRGSAPLLVVSPPSALHVNNSISPAVQGSGQKMFSCAGREKQSNNKSVNRAGDERAVGALALSLLAWAPVKITDPVSKARPDCINPPM